MNPQFTSSGIAHVWSQGDAVTRTVALVLLTMSLTTWVVFGLKLLELRSLRRQSGACEAFWHCASLAEGLERLGSETDSPFRVLVARGQEAANHLVAGDSGSQAGLHQRMNLSDWVERALRNGLDDFLANAQRGLPVLASIASTAPFVGLFGTVWGIYHALLGIGASGQVSIDQVAGPVGEALIMTAMGLLVAIPAVLGYNALVRGNKDVSHRLRRFANDLHAYFVTGARVTTGGGGKLPSPGRA